MGPAIVRKGKLEVELVTDRVSVGDEVRGHVRLRAAKAIEVTELWVALVAESDDGTDWEGDRCWREYHVQRKVLQGPTVLAAGTEQQFEFAFRVPGASETSDDLEAPATLTGLLGRGGREPRTRQRVDARLDCKGFDLKDAAPLVVDGEKYRRAIKG